MTKNLKVAALFAGVGGIEEGLRRSGAQTALLCENFGPAQAVLAKRFPKADHVGDVKELGVLPDVDLVTAGFPCTDLSQAGRTKGIRGENSGLVSHVFRLLNTRRAPILLLENVRNMLSLDRGEAMVYLTSELEALGYRWAYRLVDSRFTGVPQRRQRVILVASSELDPSAVLFADEWSEPPSKERSDNPCGFYWTEGTRGLGWAVDAVPTLKGGSGLGIPSPPAIWNPNAPLGQRIITPSIEEAEQLQGFDRCWTQPSETVSQRKGTRWTLVGNAVTTGVSEWVGDRIIRPGEVVKQGEELLPGDKWPTAAFGFAGRRWRVAASMWPLEVRARKLSEIIDFSNPSPLSLRATRGFLNRAEKSSLRFVDGFLSDVSEHAASMEEEFAA